MQNATERTPPLWRNLAIALNAVLPGNRDFACKLAARPAAWIGLHPSAVPSAAHSLGVTTAALRQALGLLPEAHQIARREIEGSERAGARIITLFDLEYPQSLFDLPLPPPVLYCQGSVPPNPAIGIVGSRRSDPYGLEAARLFARELTSAGMTVVSGLALGIDAAAHEGALDATGPTVAVLGCGIDVSYPWRNRHLAARIAECGALVTEFPLGAEPRGWRFPIRNRIIAALTHATLVVRATPKSGSLITARHSLELGRDVFALPGNIFDNRSVGTNCLIRDGAHPVQHPREIVESLPLEVQFRLEPSRRSRADGSEAAPVILDPHLTTLLECLPIGREISEEEALSRCALPLGEMLAGLLELEISGWVERHPGPRYLRRSAARQPLEPA